MSPNYFTCTLGQAALLKQQKPYCTIPEFIDYQAQASPNLPAVGTYVVNNADEAWSTTILSFKDVQDRVRFVAQGLQRKLTPDGSSTAALLAASSLDFLLTWLALMYLGRPVLLIAPQCSASAVAHLCEACEVDALFRDDQYSKLADDARRILQGDAGGVKVYDLPRITQKDLDNLSQKASAIAHKEACVSEYDVAYLHHTSGTSSGVPKPIPQTHRGGLGVLPRLDGSQDATFTTTPLYHGGIADLFRAWTSNALIWLFPGKDAPITAKNVIRCLDVSAKSDVGEEGVRISYFSSVPYVLQMLAGDERGLKYLQEMAMVGVGGAALPKEAGDDLVRTGIKLVSRFGSAECGFLLSSERDFEKDRAWQYLRHDPQVDSICFESRDDRLSELVVQSGWPHMAKRNREGGNFATADLFEPHPSMPYAWRYHSRADSQLTLVTGKKFDPAPLEAAITASSHMISDAMVFGEGEAYPGVLLFRSVDHGSVSDVELLGEIQPVIEKLNLQAQSHAQIPADMLLPMAATDLEKSSKGTLLRSVLIKRFSSTIEDAYRSSRADGTASQVDDEAVEATILKDVQGLLQSADKVDSSSDLFAHGMDSVGSMRIRNKLSRLLPQDTKLPLTIVQDCGTVRNLAKHVIAIRYGRAPGPTNDENVFTMMREIADDYSAPQKEMADIPGPLASAAKEPRQTDNTNTMLLTGATGSLGAHLLANLLEHMSELKVDHIYVLVRKNDSDDLTDRVKRGLQSRRLYLPADGVFSSRVTVLQSTMSSDYLGLDLSIYERIASSLTHIYHLAWAVNFALPLSAYRPHFAGLQNLLQLGLSCQRLKKFVFCSSTASVSSYSTLNLAETQRQSNMPESIVSDPRAAGPTGYARSKWVGEAICQSFQKRYQTVHAGDVLTVVRVGQLSGSSQTGVWNATEAYPLMLAASRQLRLVPDLDAVRRQQHSSTDHEASEECAWVPLDIAATAFVELGGLSEPCDGSAGPTKTESCVLHLLPKPGKHSCWTDIIRGILEVEPDAFHIVPIEEWLDQLETLRSDEGGRRPNGLHRNSRSHGHNVQRRQDHPALQLADFWRGAYSSKEIVQSKEVNNDTGPELEHNSDASAQKEPLNGHLKGSQGSHMATSGFNMQHSLQIMPVLHNKLPAAVHDQQHYLRKCWEWIKEDKEV